MLAVRHPTLFELDKVIESCNSTKRRQPVCTMSKSERFPRIGRSTVNLPPGHYRMDVGMVLTKDTEVLASRLTRAKSAPRFSFCKERRVDNEDCLKGLSPKYLKDISELGPGQYRLMKIGIGSNSVVKATAPSYSI
mmetsp:Transcript_137348/g.194344  ORF Transcript_137348/g.194344 Transcript_137348/m.194344 type:complete len:136 (+) Transcript_137348:52-459(+)